MIINNENIFLIFLAFVWIIGAILQDLKRREVDNIWNFSLIGFALAYRAFVSVYISDYWFFINGILGLLIFIFLGNLFYYSRLFAGGDAKLLIALGAVLPLSYDWIINFKIFLVFVVLMFLTGAFYVLAWSLFLVFGNIRKFLREFTIQLKRYRLIFIFSFVFVLINILFAFFLSEIFFALIGIIILLFPILFAFAKSIEESFMVKSVYANKLTEGEWLYKDIHVGGKIIRAKWDGVSKKELDLLQREYRGKILIKIGIPFTPGFLFGFMGLIFVLWRYGLWF
jgi:hypothetical protein